MQMRPLDPVIKSGKRVERVERVDRVAKIKQPNYYESRNYNPKRDEIVGETSQKRASRYTSPQSIYEMQLQKAKTSSSYRNLIENQNEHINKTPTINNDNSYISNNYEEDQKGNVIDVRIMQDGIVMENYNTIKTESFSEIAKTLKDEFEKIDIEIKTTKNKEPNDAKEEKTVSAEQEQDDKQIYEKENATSEKTRVNAFKKSISVDARKLEKNINIARNNNSKNDLKNDIKMISEEENKKNEQENKSDEAWKEFEETLLINYMIEQKKQIEKNKKNKIIKKLGHGKIETEQDKKQDTEDLDR